MIEAELPDGTILEFPDGTTPDVMRAAVQRMQKPQGATFGSMMKDELLRPVRAVRDLAAGAVRGAGSIGATLLAPRDAAESFIARQMGAPELQAPERRNAMSDALRSMGADPDSMAFGAGKIGAEIAGTAGVGGALAGGAQGMGAAPAVVNALRTGGMTTGGSGAADLALRAGAGAAVGGASAGMVDPSQAGTGATIGAAIPGGVAAAGKAGQMLRGALQPGQATQDIAAKAQQYGIPLGAGDVIENRGVQAVRSILRDAPLTGSMASGAREGQQEAFNRAVGGTFGAPEKKLTLQVLDQAKQRMGSEFDRIWNNNSVQVDAQLLRKLQQLDSVANKLPRNEGASLSAEIQDLMARMNPGASGAPEIPGDVANKFQQYLRRRAESSVGLRNELGDLRQALIGNFNRSVSPADAAALTMNRTQYKAFKTVEPILRSSELAVAGRTAGDVPPALLPNAVNKSYSNLNAPLADLAQVGSRFLVDRTPQTGGSARAALQNTAIGAALMGTGGLPGVAAGAAGGAALQKALQSPAGAQMLLGGMPAVNPALIQLLRSGAIAAPVVSAQ
jgi:hypothetical protein